MRVKKQEDRLIPVFHFKVFNPVGHLNNRFKTILISHTTLVTWRPHLFSHPMWPSTPPSLKNSNQIRKSKHDR